MNAIEPTYTSYFPETFRSCIQKLLEMVQCIRDVVYTILQIICSCFFNREATKTLNISELTSSQIDDIANKITLNVMERLRIGILGGAPIPGKTNRGWNAQGEECFFPVIGTKYNPNSPLLERLKPVVVNALSQAFRNPTQMEERGVDLIIYNPEGTGLLPDGYSADRIIRAFQLDSLEWKFHLSVSSEKTERNQCLTFDKHEFFNGANVGHRAFSLNEAKACARLHFVCTFSA